MSATVEPRREYGKSHLGNVFIHHFANENADRFEVRAGNHTVDVKDNLAAAEIIANALVGKAVVETPEEKAVPEGYRRHLKAVEKKVAKR